MKTTFMKIAVIALAFLAFSVCGCDSLNKKVPGNIAGVILNESGTGQGYLSIELCDQESSRVIDKQTSEDSGAFFFSGVEPGTYVFVVRNMRGEEVPSDATPLTLSLGRTKNVEVHLTGAAVSTPAE